ncbi:AAA family ATPase, partial [Loigolactobacillus coryniformis]|uniref:AAA family ATPase n=1 Tax=Loigolactobacillus coryniformis TaxID=1610 RepID=UPI00201A8AE5
EFLSTGIAPYDWLVPGFLERGDRLIVTAGEGGGKSTWLRQTALQVACGVHPWDPNVIVPARNVAIIDLENSQRQVSRRLAEMRP